jgi:hypothetical protein
MAATGQYHLRDSDGTQRAVDLFLPLIARFRRYHGDGIGIATHGNVNAEAMTEAMEIRIDELPYGALLEVQTETRTYTIRNLRNGYISICGHPKYCPEPVVARLCPPFGDKSPRFISDGMHLRYCHPVHGIVRTSPVQGIRGNAIRGRSIVRRLARIPSKLLSPWLRFAIAPAR